MTVAICTRNRAALLRECAERVLSQLDCDTRMLIVDNGSTDETPGVARSLAAAHPRITVVTEQRVGLSRGRNAALAAAESRYVVFLDDDALAEDGWLAGYRRFFEAPPAPDIAAAGGAVTPMYDAPPPRWLARGANTLYVAPDARPMTGRSLPWGGNFACDRALALEVGGFEVQLGRRGAGLGAHEETDLFRRLRRAGYSVWWLPNAPIRHRIASSKLTVRFHWYSAMASGRSTAALRLRERPGRSRQFMLLVERLVTMPIVTVFYLALAVTTAPFRGGQIAVKAMASAARASGIFWQLLVDAPRILRGGT